MGLNDIVYQLIRKHKQEKVFKVIKKYEGAATYLLNSSIVDFIKMQNMNYTMVIFSDNLKSTLLPMALD